MTDNENPDEAVEDIKNWDEAVLPVGFIDLGPAKADSWIYPHHANSIVRLVEMSLADYPADFGPEIAKYNWDVAPLIPTWLTEDHGFYYRALTCFAREFKPRAACEIGTMYGTSAMAIAKGGVPVTTYDVNLSHIADGRIFPDFGIKAVKLDHPNECEAIPFHEFDFLFIDIGDHSGDHERRIHERLVREKWKGVVFWDDVNWEGMKRFWDTVTQDKAETNWHGSSGFGVITYS